MIAEPEKTLESYILSGVKKNSLLIRFCEKHWPQNAYHYAKTILPKLSTKKFQKLFYAKQSIISGSQGDKYDPQPKAKRAHLFRDIDTDEYFPNDPHVVKIGEALLEKNKILDDKNRYLEKGREWTQNLYQSISETIPCSVAVKFKTPAPITDTINIKAYCRFDECNALYTFICSNISESQLTFKIFANSEINLNAHTYKKKRNIAGKKRDKLATEIIQFGSKLVSTKQIVSQDLLRSNFACEDTCLTLGAMRQIKHEKLGFTTLDKNDVADIMALKEITDTEPPSPTNLTPSYIRYVRADELAVVWGCQTQIECFKQNKIRIVALDATGNVSKTKGCNKRQFYYSMVFRSELSNEIVPLIEFLSSSHDIENLSNLLSLSSRSLKKHSSQESHVDTIITDFSFALMNAATLAFNKMNLFSYLETCHKKIIKGELKQHKIVLLASCSVHVIKFISDRISVENKIKRQTLMLCFAKLILTEKYFDFLELSASLYIALTSEYVATHILHNLVPTPKSKELFEILEGQAVDGDYEANMMSSQTFDEICKPKGSLYMSTSFALDIQNKIKALIATNCSNKISSSCYDPKVGDFFLRRLSPFGILWSSFAHPRETNSIVENHFKVAKNQILQTVNAKPSHVITELRVFSLSKLVPIITHPKFKISKIKSEKTNNTEDPVEDFKKTSRPKITNFEKVNNNVNQIFTQSAKNLFKPNNIALNFDTAKILMKLATFETENKYKYWDTLIGDIKLNKSDMATLNEKEWLNDKIIDASMKLLMTKKENANCLYINVLTASKIVRNPIELTISNGLILKNIEIYKFENVFIPFNKRGSHWCFVHFEPKKLVLTHYDSLTWEGIEEISKIKRFLEAKFNQENGYEIPGYFENTNELDIPLQPNGYDCGIYTLMNMRLIFNRIKISKTSYSSKDISFFRKLVKHELIEKRIMLC